MRRAASVLPVLVFLAAAVGVAVASRPSLRGRPFGTFAVRQVTFTSDGTTVRGTTCYFFLTDGAAIRLCHTRVDPAFAPTGPHGRRPVGAAIPTIEFLGVVRRGWMIAADTAAVPVEAAVGLVERGRRRTGRGFPVGPPDSVGSDGN